MKITLWHIACGVAGLVIGLSAVIFFAAQSRANDAAVIDTVYPLFDAGIRWTSKVSVTLPPLSSYNPINRTIEGYQVTSLPTESTTDVGAVVGPMRHYYDLLLLQKGWTMDTKFEADGPGGSLWGFTKGDDILILSYTSTFLNTDTGQPVRCPCTVVFTILGGTLK